MRLHFTDPRTDVNLFLMGTSAQEIRQFCAAHGLRLRKNLGQHFLTDERVLQKIIEAADIRPSDHIVEIGAGIGILTAELLKKAAKVTAIELDARLIPLLQEYVTTDYSLPTTHSLTVIHGDALQVDFPQEPYKIVANIPYQITSPLLRHAFVESSVRPTSLTLLIQKEVAEKITEGGNRLSILVQLFGVPRIVLRVPPAAFLPQPRVHSAVLHIRCFEKPLTESALLETVFHLTEVAFQGKRKMLRGTLRKLPGGMEVLTKAAIEPMRRPETLTVEEWIRLARLARGMN